MSIRARWLLIAVASLLALGMTGAVGVVAWQQYQQRQSAPSAVDTTRADAVTAPGRIVFRNTASGAGYGFVASVPLSDPGAARAVSEVACDRVDATPEEFSCLQSVRGITPTFAARLYTAQAQPVAEWPLPGIPSRTRISADGSLIATTSFITGHSYASIGFSTETVIHTTDGRDFGNLEDWALTIDGAPSAPFDRNYWGVTFVDDDTFYATVGMTVQGVTYLVRGSLRNRTLDALAENVECPSLSPDGTRIAFKRVVAGSGATVHWAPAIYDIASGEITVLPETRSIDDQIEWLDDDTILYGLPREDAVGDDDVWSLAADGSGDPAVFLEHASSPSVVR